MAYRRPHCRLSSSPCGVLFCGIHSTFKVRIPAKRGGRKCSGLLQLLLCAYVAHSGLKAKEVHAFPPADFFAAGDFTCGPGSRIQCMVTIRRCQWSSSNLPREVIKCSTKYFLCDVKCLVFLTSQSFSRFQLCKKVNHFALDGRL